MRRDTAEGAPCPLGETAHSSGKTSARALTGAADKESKRQTGLLANTRAGSVTAARLFYQLYMTTIAPTPRGAAARSVASRGREVSNQIIIIISP